MNPLLSSPPLAWHRSPPPSNDVEMLQTDVMRFFAILCLCLMAIFALVKALPMSPPSDRPTMTTPPNSKNEAAALEKQLAALKERVARLQARLAVATETLEDAQAQAADATARAQEALSRLADTREELTAVSQTLKTVRREIKTREAVLAGIVQDIEAKRGIREELNTVMAREEQQYQTLQTRLDQVAVKLRRASRPEQPLPKPSPPAPVPPPPAGKGFMLRFASDKALDTLVKRGIVQFYALAGQKAWKLNLAGEPPVYTAVQMPAEIYEMETATVPPDYIARFSREIAAFGQGKVTWGVTLPENTANAIVRLIQNRERGDLIIMPSGEVILK